MRGAREAVCVLLAVCGVSAQTASPVPPPDLPAYAIGLGTSWNRAAPHPLNADLNLAIHLGPTSNWYSWTTISTPIAKSPPGTPPLSSSVLTGVTYVAARNDTGSLALLLNFQGGFTAQSNLPATLPATSLFSPSVLVDAGVAIRLWHTNLYLMPYASGKLVPVQDTAGGPATSVLLLQPGVMLFYGFGGGH